MDKANKKVKAVMREFKGGTLHSGKKGPVVKSKKQAIAIALSEAKKSPKSAARRKSFCGRMCGMKSKLTSAKTAKDPNSRINKSLRAWDCNCK